MLAVIALACPDVIPVLAVLTTCSSKIVFDITPLTKVVATGITASVPSEETIVRAPVVPVMVKFVATFVALAVLAVIALACPDVIPVLAVLAATAVAALTSTLPPLTKVMLFPDCDKFCVSVSTVAFAQESVPLPLVANTWFAVPSVFGMVIAPAVIVPLVFTSVIDVFPS